MGRFSTRFWAAYERCHSDGRMVHDLMTPTVVSVESTMTLREAANLMLERHIDLLPVFDGGRLVGIVRDTDVFDELGSQS